MKQFLLYQFPAIALATLIFILSSIPDIPMPRLEFKLQDKVIHFMVYAVLGVLVGRAFYFQEKFPQLKIKYVLYAMIASVLYGLSDEVHQYFVPGRTADVFDFLADALGVVFGVILLRYWIVSQRVSSTVR